MSLRSSCQTVTALPASLYAHGVCGFTPTLALSESFEDTLEGAQDVGSILSTQLVRPTLQLWRTSHLIQPQKSTSPSTLGSQVSKAAGGRELERREKAQAREEKEGGAGTRKVDAMQSLEDKCGNKGHAS